jgi:sugar transferase EpsL
MITVQFWKVLVKRATDVVLSTALLVLLAPVMAAVYTLTRFSSSGPAIFKQQRPGLHGKIFVLYKFKTMTGERGSDGQLLPDVERLTSWGSFLRRTSLDELPQLWNVLIGNMSLVGPRPLLIEYLERYTPFQARRHEVKPGITGWAQVNGRNAAGWERKFALDIWYVDHWNAWIDFKILLMTARKVVMRDQIALESLYMGSQQSSEDAAIATSHRSNVCSGD